MLARLASAVHFQSATMPPMMRPISLVVWMIVWLLPLAPVCAADLLRIEGVTWGFDGTVVANSFNPVSFSLHNDSNDPMNLPLKLERSDGVKTIDAPVGVAGPLDPVFLAPNSSRRVQLFAYVQGNPGEFMLSWGRDPRQRLDLTANVQLEVGRPATVILFDPEAVTQRGSGMPRFDETFFPVSASGAAGLAGVVLDHDPRMQTIQQQAFLDWVRAGGVVHLTEQSEGVRPEFSGELAALNSPLDEQRFGAGLVVRHHIPMAEFNRDVAELTMLPRQPLQLKPAPEQDENAANSYTGYLMDWDVANHVFMRVKQMTRPDHNWPLIYVMSFVYLALIFPGCWLIGRRKADYRLTYGAMLGAVVLFSMGFKQVGQRGYGEQTAMHAITIAQPLDGNRLLFRQWANLFVTDGDDYRIHHAGNGLLYSSGQSNEAVRGWIVSPPAGQFVADVPPFSSRTVAAAGVAETGGFTPLVEELAIGEKLDALRVRLDPPLAQPSVIAQALYRDQLYDLQPAENGGYQLQKPSAAFETGLQTDQWQQYGYNYGFGYGDDVNTEELFATARGPMLAASVGVHNEETQKRFQLADDRVRIFLYAEMPESLYAKLEYAAAPDAAVQTKRDGRVLYAFDVFPPE